MLQTILTVIPIIIAITAIVSILSSSSTHSPKTDEKEERHNFVKTYRFPEVAKFVLARERPDLDEQTKHDAWEALRTYFLLHTDNNGKFLGMPSETVDAAWHAFMICSKEYFDFCDKAFGRYLHHTPDMSAAPGTMTENAPIKDDVIATWQALERQRSLHPELALAAVPALFALDAAIGKGWIYTPESIEKLRRTKDDTSSSSGDGGFVPAMGDTGTCSSHGDCGGSSGGSDGGSSCSGSSCGGGGCGGGCGG